MNWKYMLVLKLADLLEKKKENKILVLHFQIWSKKQCWCVLTLIANEVRIVVGDKDRKLVGNEVGINDGVEGTMK